MGALSRDFARMQSAFLHGAGPVRRFYFVLTNSELHCVAAYRLGQYASRLRRRSKLPGLALTVVHRLWNRWITHIDHCDVDHRAQIGDGFLIMHRSGVIIGPSAIGRNFVIHQNVTIGQRVAGRDQGVPQIGDNVWIGPGAVVTGSITVGDGVTISAGSIVSRDVPAGSLVAGNPGRVIARDYDNSEILGLSADPETGSLPS